MYPGCWYILTDGAVGAASPRVVRCVSLRRLPGDCGRFRFPEFVARCVGVRSSGHPVRGFSQGGQRLGRSESLAVLDMGYALGMTFEALLDLLHYHYWARDRLLDAVVRLPPAQFRQDLGNSFGSIRDTLVHIVSAEWVWCSRWQGELQRKMLPPSNFRTVKDIRNRWLEEEARVRRFVVRLGPAGVDRVFRYSHPDGTESASVFWHMLQHVVNHATYHRGQVTTMLRQFGAEPPPSQDLIAFYLRPRR